MVQPQGSFQPVRKFATIARRRAKCKSAWGLRDIADAAACGGKYRFDHTLTVLCECAAPRSGADPG
jgi:hypothetical protein